MLQKAVLGFCAILLLVAATGCGSGNSALNPKFQPQVANQTDNFQFQATGVTNVTQSLTYTWQDTGSAATVNQASTITAGTANIVLKDASGATVYTANLSSNGTFATPNGVSGNWTIVVSLTNTNGTLNFRVQKL